MLTLKDTFIGYCVFSIFHLQHCRFCCGIHGGKGVFIQALLALFYMLKLGLMCRVHVLHGSCHCSNTLPHLCSSTSARDNQYSGLHCNLFNNGITICDECQG